MPPIHRDFNLVTATIPSGSTTSSGVYLRGFVLAGCIVPVLTSAVVSFGVAFTGVTITPVADSNATVKTIATPGGTGGVAIDGDSLAFLAPFFGPLYVSAAAAQAADRAFVFHLKG